jgi:hypothetical protein
MGLVGVAFQAFDKTFPHFSPDNPLHYDVVRVVCFGMLVFSLYYFARKPLASEAVLEEVEREE